MCHHDMAASTTSEEDLINRLHGLDSSSGCFEEARFVNPSEIKRHYICPVGKGVLNNPRKVPCCRNAFCHFCITMCTIPLNDGERFPQQLGLLKCPLCREVFDANQLAEVSLNFENVLNELRIRCSFKECKRSEPLGDIAFHQLHCKYNPEREETCSFCNIRLPYLDLTTHYCKEKFQKKYEDGEIKAKEVKLELDKQKEMLEKLLK